MEALKATYDRIAADWDKDHQGDTWWLNKDYTRDIVSTAMEAAMNETMECLDVVWLVYRQDNSGVRYLIKDGSNLSETAADEIIRPLREAQERKPHKMDYFKRSYQRGMLYQVLSAERIIR